MTLTACIGKFTHKSFIQISHNHIKSSQILCLGVKGLNTICIIIQNEMIHFKTIFRLIVFIAVNVIEDIVFYGKKSGSCLQPLYLYAAADHIISSCLWQKL